MFQVIESSLKFGRQLDSDHIPLQHFFIVLEHVLRHGLRPKKVTSKFKIRKMTNWQTEVKLMKMVNFLILPNKSHKSHLLRLKGKQINSFLFGLYWIFLQNTSLRPTSTEKKIKPLKVSHQQKLEQYFKQYEVYPQKKSCQS